MSKHFIRDEWHSCSTCRERQILWAHICKLKPFVCVCVLNVEYYLVLFAVAVVIVAIIIQFAAQFMRVRSEISSYFHFNAKKANLICVYHCCSPCSSSCIYIVNVNHWKWANKWILCIWKCVKRITKHQSVFDFLLCTQYIRVLILLFLVLNRSGTTAKKIYQK